MIGKQQKFIEDNDIGATAQGENIKIFLGDDDEEDQVEVIDEEIDDMGTEENQVTVTGDDPRYEARSNSVAGKYHPDKRDIMGKNKQKSTDNDGGLEGFGGIVGVGQFKKQGIQSVKNKNSEDSKASGLGIGIGGGVLGKGDKRMSGSGSTPSNQLASLNAKNKDKDEPIATDSGLPLSIVGSGVGGAGQANQNVQAKRR